MWTATYITPDPNMPKVFMPSDNYERFLPTLAKRYEKTFNPFRLKVRIHLGVDADEPINRGTTPDYNDCFFNCAGQKPNYVDLFATAGSLSRILHSSLSTSTPSVGRCSIFQEFWQLIAVLWLGELTPEKRSKQMSHWSRIFLWHCSTLCVSNCLFM